MRSKKLLPVSWLKHKIPNWQKQREETSWKNVHRVFNFTGCGTRHSEGHAMSYSGSSARTRLRLEDKDGREETARVWVSLQRRQRKSQSLNLRVCLLLLPPVFIYRRYPSTLIPRTPDTHSKTHPRDHTTSTHTIPPSLSLSISFSLVVVFPPSPCFRGPFQPPRSMPCPAGHVPIRNGFYVVVAIF